MRTFTSQPADLWSAVCYTVPVSYTHLDVYKRQPLDRIGYGGYLKLALKFPDFVDYIEEVCNEFRELYEHVHSAQPMCMPFKVTILNKMCIRDSVWSVDDYVDFLQELLDHLQITHVSFIAHSFGARIALRYACLLYTSCRTICKRNKGIRK